jgi:hypothetical protein
VTAGIDAGLCMNEQCAGAARVEPIERYPGPGAYCPDCGQLLVPASGAETPPSSSSSLTLAPRRDKRRIVIAAGAIVIIFIALVGFAVIGTRSVGALSVRVCTSTMTDRVADEIVRAYSARGTWPFHYDVTRPGDRACDVRFFVSSNGNDGELLARDGVVAVVNPQNTTAQLDISQLRDILAGRIVNWSQLGARPGAIAAAVPEDSSDEAHLLARRVMLGAPLGSNIVRNLTAAQIVGRVSSPSGRGWIGLVPFSAALPAKVLALGKAPPPSTISIADGRYPMSAGIMVASDFRQPSRPTAALIAFARSTAGEDVFARAGLISKNAP